MPAASRDFKADQGSRFSVVFTLKDVDELPIDASAVELKGQMRSSFSDPAVAAEFQFEVLDENAVEGDPLFGKVRMFLSDTVTSALVIPAPVGKVSPTARPTKSYIYDVECLFAGVRKRILEGSFTLSGEVTRA